MISKFLILSICTLSLVSCGQEWEVVTGPIKKYGESDDPALENPKPLSSRTPRARRRPVTPQPLKDNPFAVPEVTKDLPNEKDLKPSAPAPAPVSVDPIEDNDPTVTAKPPAPEE